MSFSTDPYSEMTVVSNGDGTLSWQCESCGGGWRLTFPADARVADLRISYNEHLDQSHDRTPSKES